LVELTLLGMKRIALAARVRGAVRDPMAWR